MTVQIQSYDGVAVLVLDNPPVNGLGLATRQALADALAAAQADADVRGIVITGAGGLFCGGADIREFNSPQALQSPSLDDLIAALEASTKPVVMALNGTTFGGGLELALAAHYRVAVASALLGLPEVKIGLLPGAGGTQRLPRAAGLQLGLEMITTGTPQPASALAATRLLDEVVRDDAVAAAVALANKAAAAGGHLPLVREWQVEHEHAASVIAAARAKAAALPYPAPLHCVDAVAAACELPFEQGLAQERAAFVALLQSPESHALRHAFFGERAASKVPGLGPAVKPRTVRSAGVVGAGTMGSGIAMCFLNAGLPLTLVETSQAALDRGVAAIHAYYAANVKKGRFDAAEAQRRLELLQPSLEIAALADADLIVEAVFEDYAAKKSVFQALDAVAKPGAILASNTSTLDLDRIASFTQRPGDVLGMHFFSPAQVMKLLEVVRGAQTRPEVLATALQLARVLGKTAVVAGVCDGFIGNRMLEQYIRQAGFLLDEGALPQQVDRAIEAFGFAMGPFRMGDLAGNDIGWAIRKRRAVEQPDMIYSRTADLVCEVGRFGQKSGKGWYDYAPGERTALPSPEVDELIVRHSQELGLMRRAISDEEIVERLLFPLVNEGALILQQGIAAKASDIDVVYLAGYGFPAWRGGPLFHADSVGLPRVVAAMQRYAQGYRGEAWTVAPLLADLAAREASFNGAAA